MISFNNMSSKRSLKSLGENIQLNRGSSLSDLKKKLTTLNNELGPLSFDVFDEQNDPLGMINSNSIQQLPDKTLMEIEEEQSIKRL